MFGAAKKGKALKKKAAMKFVQVPSQVQKAPKKPAQVFKQKKPPAPKKAAAKPAKRATKKATKSKPAQPAHQLFGRADLPSSHTTVSPFSGAQPPSRPFAQQQPQTSFGFGAHQQYQQQQAVPSHGFGEIEDDADQAPLFGDRAATQQLASLLTGQAPPVDQQLHGVGFPVAIPPQSNVSKMLLLLARMGKEGLITSAEKGQLKDKVIARDYAVISALQVFEVDRDFNELADTLKRICRLG